MMDRLTKRDKGGNAHMDCDKCDIRYREGCCSQRLCKNLLIDRLAAYEDTGLTPEEIKEDMPDVRKIEEKLAAYGDAEANGLLVRLPCKVGDVVWWIPPLHFSWLEHRAYQCMVVSVTITENKKRERRHKYRIAELRDGKTTANVRDIDFTDIGKTVFMTRKEVEAALADDKE